jgi:hypothetical protein
LITDLGLLILGYGCPFILSSLCPFIRKLLNLICDLPLFIQGLLSLICILQLLFCLLLPFVQRGLIRTRLLALFGYVCYFLLRLLLLLLYLLLLCGNRLLLLRSRLARLFGLALHKVNHVPSIIKAHAFPFTEVVNDCGFC